MLGDQELSILDQGARRMGVTLSERQLAQFSVFTDMLLEWNRKFNLTRITEPREIVLRHYLDSLTCLAAAEFKLDAKVIDVGTGAGFPGIPVEIARPDLEMTLLDSTRKRLIFLDFLVERLGLGGVRLFHARAEEAGRDFEHREFYDVAMARAVGKMNVLAEFCLPLVRPGGVMIAQKGPEALREVGDAEGAVNLLGGELEKIARLRIPFSNITRNLPVIRKLAPTPSTYPRRPALIQKRPL